MLPEDKTAAPDSAPPATRAEPPKIYVAACGVLCDLFWWARRNSPDAAPHPLTALNDGKQ